MKRGNDYYYGWDGMTKEHMVGKMRKGWRSQETPCGRGSEREMARNVTRLLPIICTDYEIRVLYDAGAGDCNWVNDVEWRDGWPVDYHGYDLVPRSQIVEELDIVHDPFPAGADAILCRHVLNHLSANFALSAIDNFTESGASYLLLTMCDNQTAYWRQHGLILGEPVNVWHDCLHWDLHLYELQSERLWERRR